MENSTFFAGIDIGSNAIRLLIATPFRNETAIEVKKSLLIRIPVRLGEDVFTEGKIGEKKIGQLIEALTGFKHIMLAYNVVNFRAFATSAMREAANNRRVVRKIHEESGIEVEIIEGEREADLICSAGATVTANVRGEINYMYVDVGGGSTEITIFHDNRKVASRSFQLGAVRILSQGENQQLLNELVNWISEIVKLYKPDAIVGTGGNINKIHKIINKKKDAPIFRTEIHALYEKLKQMSLTDRIEKMQLNPSRADVIVPAMQLFLHIMQVANIQAVFVPKVGLADGIVQQLFLEKSTY
ncbi:MAG: ethanolamine ammonia-lyase reactivating factor EutA [Bacteroidales bacterium]|jgi:exopolyphosphatase/guanosine-5'-triphosphate,3'-diphosphate pyrophosphatase|nr:ethanolamine ammonia-lyase reactivating factor EutA [Bacteroidales bacterium]